MPTLREDAEMILEGKSVVLRTEAATRLARAYLDAFAVRTVSEGSRSFVIVDADHYESLIAQIASINE